MSEPIKEAVEEQEENIEDEIEDEEPDDDFEHIAEKNIEGYIVSLGGNKGGEVALTIDFEDEDYPTEDYVVDEVFGKSDLIKICKFIVRVLTP